MNTAIEICMWICLFYGLTGLVKTAHRLANSAAEKLSESND